MVLFLWFKKVFLFKYRIKNIINFYGGKIYE